MLRSLAISCLLLCLTACTKVWTPRTISACYQSSGVAEVDRERSYYALLLALSETRYVIVHADAPRQIEAEFYTSYKPGRAYTRWLIDAADDGTLRVQSIPPERRYLSGQERLFNQLSINTRRLSCRDLNWLRWEAQNRGLVPLVSDLPGPDADPPAAGGEQPGSPEPSGAQGTSSLGPTPSGPAQFATLPQAASSADANPLDPAVLSQKLRSERSKIRLGPGIGLIALAVGLAGAAVPVTLAYVRQADADCERPGRRAEDGSCKSPPLHVTGILVADCIMVAAATVAMIIGAPLLHRRLQRRRNLERHLRMLEQPTVGVGATAHGVNLSLRAAF